MCSILSHSHLSSAGVFFPCAARITRKPSRSDQRNRAKQIYGSKIPGGGKPSSILDLVSRIGETIKARCFAETFGISCDAHDANEKKEREEMISSRACVCVHVYSTHREVSSAISFLENQVKTFAYEQSRLRVTVPKYGFL